jgi:hypothetical protein
MASTTQCADALTPLSRGEQSAVETYEQALAKFEGRPEAPELGQILREHEQAVSTLRQHVLRFGGEMPASSGTWGAFASLVEGTAKLFGYSSALAALRHGEEQGVRDYESAMKNKDLSADCLTQVRSVLLPQTRHHVIVLERLIASLG